MFGGDHVHVCYGWETEAYRETRNIAKTHANDAAGIAVLGAEIADIIRIEQFYEVRQFRRHDRAIINNQRQRTYRLDGKIVAKNRKKGFAQKEPSLKEYAASLPPEERQKTLSQLRVTPSKRSYNNLERKLAGTVFWSDGCRYVMSGQKNHGFCLRAGGEGDRDFKASLCRIVPCGGLVYI